jgi:hypothetical protein
MSRFELAFVSFMCGFAAGAVVFAATEWLPIVQVVLS